MNSYLLQSNFKHLFHISDIHIRNEESYKDNYQTQFQKTFSQIQHHPNYHPKTSLIVVTGDIFHSSLKVSAIAIELLRVFTEGLTSLGPTIIIPGNHDEKKDVGEYDTSSLSALFNYNVGETKNLFYLKDSGFYSFGDNLIFGHTSVIDKQLIPAKDIPSSHQHRIKIALFHGMVDSKDNNDYLLKGCDFAYTDFNGYDKVLLGDVHKYQNIAGQPHIFYSGSLIQQHYGEDRRLHGGLLVWDLHNTTPPQYIPIQNDHQYITLEIYQGNIRGETSSPQGSFHIRKTIPFDLNTLPLSSSIKFKCTDTTPVQIIELFQKLNQKTKIIDYKTEYLKLQQQQTHSIQQHQQDKPTLESFLTQYHNKDKDKLLELDKTYKKKQSTTSSKHTRWCPLELKWENMFNYVGSHQLDFQTIPDGLTSICGPNASGKSKLIEIFTLSIFGIKPNLVPHIVSNGLTKANTSIKIQLYQDIWEIKWTFTMSKSKKGDTKVTLFKNDIKVNSTDKKGNEYTIKQLFGELDDLCNTHISKQGRHEKFIYLTPNEQGQLLTRLFETNVYEDTHKEVKKDITEQKKTLKDIEKHIKTQLPSTIEKKNELEIKKTQLHKQNIQTQTIIEEMEQKIRTNDIHIEQKKRLAQQSLSLTQHIQQLKIQLKPIDIDTNICIDINRKDILKQIETYTQNLHPNLSPIDNIDELEIKKTQLSQMNKKLETYQSKLEHKKNKIESYTTLKPQLQTQINNTQSKKDTLLSQIPFQKQWTYSTKKQYQDYIDSKQQHDPSLLEKQFLNINIQDMLDLHQIYLKQQTQMESLNESSKDIQNEINELESYIQSDPYSYNQQCKNCLHNKNINHISDKENKLQTLHKKQSTNLNKQQDVTKWIENHQDLPRLYQDYQTLQQLREIQLIKQEYQEYLTFLNNKQQLETYTKQLVDDKEKYNQIETNLTSLYIKQDRLQEKMHQTTLTKKDLDTTLKTYERQRSQIETNQQLHTQIQQCKHQLIQFDQYQTNLDIEKEIKRDTQTHQEIQHQLKQLTIQDPNELKHILHTKKKEREHIIRRETTLEHDLQELERMNRNIQESKNEFHTKTKDLDLLKTYQKITNDFPNYCNSKYIEQFQNNINFYLLNMTKDFSITIHYEKKENKHDIQFLKNNSIPIEHCSGFEKFVISISIRIALSILSPTHSMNLMMIDEGFGVFDHKHNKQLLKMLEPLQSIFKQIFIITHLDELQYEIPHKIKIKNGRICS